MLNKKRSSFKGLKKIIASTLAVVLFLTPVTSTLAAETKETTGSAITVTNESVVNLTGYDKVKAVADEKLAYLTTYLGVTSAQYAIIDNGEIKLSGQSGVYSKTNNVKLTNNTMYGIGSISKMYTTVAVMQLVEQGKLKLDEPVVTYIPEFKMNDARYKDITVRMLLNHSSGLMGSTFKDSWLYAKSSTVGHDNFLKELSTQRLKADPGAFSVYCNDGFTLAEILVEKVSKTDFTNYIEKNISTPLNAGYTKTPESDFNTNRLAKTYIGESTTAYPQEALNAIGAGGIYSTAEELCLFAETFMKDSNDLLNAESIKAMESKEYANGIWKNATDNILSYGLGWDSVETYPFNRYGIKALVKGGDTQHYHGSMIVLPEQNMAIAVLSSGGASIYAQLAGQEILLEALKETGRIDEIKPYKTFEAAVKQDMPASLKQYEGIYASITGIITVKMSDDGLLSIGNAYAPDAGTEEYIYIGNGEFASADGSTTLDFTRERNNMTYLGINGYSVIPGLGETAMSYYMSQKVEPVEVSEKAMEAWAKRHYKSYFLVDEKYNSIIYAAAPALGLAVLDQLPGYMYYNIITDENTTVSPLQIPGSGSRDLADYYVTTKDGIEYIHGKGNTFVSQDAMKALSTKSSFTVTIGKDGYSKWYYIGDKSASKKISVKLPKNSSYVIYDSTFVATENSVVNKKAKVKLPNGGYVVFVGEAGTKINVSYTK